MRLECLNLGGRTVGTCATLAAVLLAAGSAFAQANAPAANPPAKGQPAGAPAATAPNAPQKPQGGTSATDKPAATKTGGAGVIDGTKSAAPKGETRNLTEEELIKELRAQKEAQAAKDGQSARQGAPVKQGAPEKVGTKNVPTIDGTQRPTEAQAAIADGPPAIQFDPPIANMGEMAAGEAKTITVKIKNITDQPIRIIKAIPGCGCTTPVWPKDPIAPGASADCEITLRPGDKGGVHLTKKVTFNIENHSAVVLSVEGDVVAFVTLTPEMLEQPADLVGAKPSDLTLEAADGVAFKVLEMSPPIVKDMPTAAATKHVLKVDWGMWEETGRQMRLVIKTDHPKAQQLATLVRRAVTANGVNAPTPPAGPQAVSGPGTTDLITAIRANDLSKMKALMDGGANVNEQDRAGSRTALHWAAKNGNKEALAALIAAKADPNLKDRQGRTAIWGGVETNPEIVKFLVEHGADINARDTINSTPLLWAAGFGRPETVSYLLSKGADVKAVDDNGWSSLIWAAGLGQPQTVDILVKAGADLKLADRQTGDTPLLRAARTGKPESMKILLAAGADINARNKLAQTALHLAAQSGSADKVSLLLAAKADPAAVDSRNFTALDHAMSRTTGDKTKLLEILKPVSPAPKTDAASAPATPVGSPTDKK